MNNIKFPILTKKKYYPPFIREIHLDTSIILLHSSPIFDTGAGGENEWLGHNPGNNGCHGNISIKWNESKDIVDKDLLLGFTSNSPFN